MPRPGTSSTNAGTSRAEPTSMNSARRPTLSTIKPNSGVATIADNGSTLLRNPPSSRVAPCPSMKNLMAKLRNGNTAE